MDQQLLLLLLLILLTVSGATCKLTTSRTDRTPTVDVGDEVTFECRTNELWRQIRWRFYPPGTVVHDTIYNGVQMNPKYSERFKVNDDRTSGHSALSFFGIQPGDAGIYSCSEATTENALEFQLVVGTDGQHGTASRVDPKSSGLAKATKTGLTIVSSEQPTSIENNSDQKTNIVVGVASSLAVVLAVVATGIVIAVIVNRRRRMDNNLTYENAAEMQKTDIRPTTFQDRRGIPIPATPISTLPRNFTSTDDSADPTHSHSSQNSSVNGSHHYSQINDSSDVEAAASAVAEPVCVVQPPSERPYNGLDPAAVAERQSQPPPVYAGLRDRVPNVQ